MDSAPLVKAHDHAREASRATHAADISVAISEHALAAGEFATAANSTSSIEALRTLRLLERHHERLSQLSRYSLEHPSLRQQQQQEQRQQQQQQQHPFGETTDEKEAASITGAASTATTTSNSGVGTRGDKTGYNVSAGQGASSTAEAMSAAAAEATMKSTATSAAVAPVSSTTSGPGATAAKGAAAASAQAQAQAQAHPQYQRRYPPSRELSSSIASKLASARGIPSRHRGQPAAPSVSSDNAPGSVEGQARQDESRSHMQSILQQQQQQQPGKPSWVPPKHVPISPKRAQAPASPRNTAAALGGEEGRADEGFSRFYSRFGSIINRLSAPLAFAGLPLTIEEEAEEAPGSEDLLAAEQKAAAQIQQQQHQQQLQQQQRKHGRHKSASAVPLTTSASVHEPELSRIYSKAALRALGRDGYSAASDSFYVVPKTGHMASYASILSYDQKEKRRLTASVHGLHPGRDDDLLEEGDEQDFADAKQAPQTAYDQNPRGALSLPSRSASPSPSLARRLAGASRLSLGSIGGGGGSGSGSGNGGGKDAQRLVEELYTENQSLKDTLDKLSKRLHAFEASAQHSHMALQESMRFMRPGSPPGGVPGGTGGGPRAGGPGTVVEDGDSGLATRVKELEDDLVRMQQRLEASDKERLHQEKTLQKYRDKWEKLKAGAKARREAQGDSRPLTPSRP